MQETPVLVVIELVSVEDAAGLRSYIERAAALIGPLGGVMVGRGGVPVEGEPGFGPLVLQRWPSEAAFRLAGQRSLSAAARNSTRQRHDAGGSRAYQRRAGGIIDAAKSPLLHRGSARQSAALRLRSRPGASARQGEGPAERGE